jgi:hypothetical protein
VSPPQSGGNECPAPPSAAWRPGLGHSSAAHRRCWSRAENAEIWPRTRTQQEVRRSRCPPFPLASTGEEGSGSFPAKRARKNTQKKGDRQRLVVKADRHERHTSSTTTTEIQYLLITGKAQKGESTTIPIPDRPASQPTQQENVCSILLLSFPAML